MTPNTEVDATDDPAGFTDLALCAELLRAVAALGYEEPTPIQRAAIPPLLAGSDLLGQAATGTGKTAAFALPLLQRMPRSPGPGQPTALVLVPTRELAIQVCDAIRSYGTELGARVLAIYGGQPIGRQLRDLERGVEVVVATPGRALDHLRRGTLRLEQLTTVVLDEADEMLDMGFAEDIEAILAETPAHRQTVLFSATLPSRIDDMVARHLRNPTRVRLGPEQVVRGEDPRVRQTAYLVPRSHKPAALARILDIEAPTAAIVFCRTRDEVDQLTELLHYRGHRADALHGGMSQEQRDRVMARLRGGAAGLIVATDVAARGLDIEQLTHVVNYDVPSAPESYVHRIGRVGRAGRDGVAIMLAEPREYRMIRTIQRVTGQRIEMGKVPSVADLRARRLEQTSTALREAVLDEDLEQFRALVEGLSEDHDLVRVALAAVKLAHTARAGADDQEEIPEVTLGRGRPPRAQSGEEWRRKARGSGRAPTGSSGRAPAGGMTRLFVGAGRSAGIRPQDLVGAIAGEAGLRGREIGSIEIADRFSLVEVPEAAADAVVNAMRGRSIKGRKATIRRDRATTS